VFEAALDRMIELGRREEWMDYLLAKGMKIHGGINQYVNYFFDVGMNPIDRVLSLPESDHKDMLTLSVTIELQKMLIVHGLTAENRVRVQAAIDRLNPPIPGAAAPAAGGARRRSRRRRATRRASRRRSNRY
jgi:hypothetical protein